MFLIPSPDSWKTGGFGEQLNDPDERACYVFPSHLDDSLAVDRRYAPPWQLHATELLPIAEALATSLSCVSPDNVPPAFRHFPVGTWCSESELHYLYELRQYDLADPLLVFPGGLPRDRITATFATWIRAGSDPPPGKAYEESPNGRVVVDNGHHRAAALALARRDTVQLWVCPMAWQAQEDNPNQLTAVRLTHREAVKLALEAGYKVPSDVRSAYPDLGVPLLSEGLPTPRHGR